MKFRVTKTYDVQNSGDTEYTQLVSACFSGTFHDVKIFKESKRYYTSAAYKWSNIAEAWGTSYVEALKSLLLYLKNRKLYLEAENRQETENYLAEMIELTEQVFEYLSLLESE